MTVIIVGGLIVLCLYLYSQIPPKEVVQPFISKFPAVVSIINRKLNTLVSGSDIRTIILSGRLDNKYEFNLSMRYSAKNIMLDLNITDNISYNRLQSTALYISDSQEQVATDIINFVLGYHKIEQQKLNSKNF